VKQHPKTEIAQVKVDKPQDNLAAFIRVKKNTSGKPKSSYCRMGLKLFLPIKVK